MQVKTYTANCNLVLTLSPRPLTAALLFVDSLLLIWLALDTSYSHALPLHHRLTATCYSFRIELEGTPTICASH